MILQDGSAQLESALDAGNPAGYLLTAGSYGVLSCVPWTADLPGRVFKRLFPIILSSVVIVIYILYRTQLSPGVVYAGTGSCDPSPSSKGQAEYTGRITTAQPG